MTFDPFRKFPALLLCKPIQNGDLASTRSATVTKSCIVDVKESICTRSALNER